MWYLGQVLNAKVALAKRSGKAIDGLVLSLTEAPFEALHDREFHQRLVFVNACHPHIMVSPSPSFSVSHLHRVSSVTFQCGPFRSHTVLPKSTLHSDHFGRAARTLTAEHTQKSEKEEPTGDRERDRVGWISRNTPENFNHTLYWPRWRL